VAVKDCIKLLKKAGHKVEPEDVKMLTKYVANGLTDAQAVMRLFIDASVDVISITDRVSEAGGDVETGTGKLAEIKDFRTEKLRAMMGERAEIVEKIEGINADYKLLLQDASLFDELLSKALGFNVEFENLTENEIKMHIGQLMMRATTTEIDPNNRGRIWPEDRFRVAMENKTLPVHGLTPNEIYDSRVELTKQMSDNRKQIHLLNQERLEAQTRIDAGFKATTTRELFQGPVDETLDSVAAKAEVNKRRMAQLLGEQLYKDMHKVQMVTIKETFQNSFDAVRTALRRGDIEDGHIHIEISDDGRTMTITDNGVGMTAEEINEGFLTMAGSKKEGDVNSGGFGVAKLLFLAGNKALTLETVRDGVKTTLNTTGEDFLESLNDPTHPLDSRYSADQALRRVKTDEDNGTKISVTLLDDYVDYVTGTTQEVKSFKGWQLSDTTNDQMLEPRITVTKTSGEISEEASAGKNFDSDRYRSIGTVQLEWGTADILIEKIENEYVGSQNTTIAIEGLNQLTLSTTENPWQMGAEHIKRRIFINIHPDMEAGEPGYPMGLNRQSLQGHAESDIFQIQTYLSVLMWRDKTEEMAKGYGTIRTVDINGFTGDLLDLTPPPTEQVSLTGRIAEGSDLKVEGGELVIDGVAQGPLDKETMQAESRPDSTEYIVDQALVPRDKPLIHNQMTFKPDASDLNVRFIEDTPVEPGSDLMEALYETFGEQRVNEYYFEIGNSFMRMRDLLAVKGDQGYFAGLDKIGVGVSVLGNHSYGVHTKVPAGMMFINPAQDPREHRMRDPLSSAPFDIETSDIKTIAASMLTTMVHEAAHYAEMNHDIGFIFALQNAFSTLLNESNYVDVVRNRLEETLDGQWQIYRFIAEAIESESIENTGLSFADVGQESQRDDVGAGGPVRGREGRQQRAGDTAEAQAGDATAQGQFDDDAISAGIREGGVVVPEGSVNPLAGTDSPILQGQRAENLAAFMEGSVVVNEDGTPQEVYHGSQWPEPFEEFIPTGSMGGFNNMGSWFSSEPEHAERMAHHIEEGVTAQMIPAHLSIKKPFDTTWEAMMEEIDYAIQVHNDENPDAIPLNKRGGTRDQTSAVGTFLKEYFQGLGYDGIIIRDWDGDGAPTQDVFVAFESNQIKSSIGNEGTFDAEDPSILKQGERGRISFNEARKGFIEILTSGDSSTFIHETGHMYLEVMKWAAQTPNAPDQMVKDWETIKQQTGATDEGISEEAHEKFANMFEVYTLEGKAPSVALQDAFNAYRRWMLNIYARLKGIAGVHVNEEIRGVFDRMLASDAEIAVAEQTQGFVALFADAESAGMTQERFDYYAKQLQRTHDDAVEKETRRMLAAMTRDEKAWWQEERAKLRAEIEDEAHEMRVYVALAMLQKGKQPDGSPTRGLAFKIDKKSLMRLLADDQETLNALPRPFIYARKGGTDVDLAANRLGYKDGMTMIREIINAPPMEQYIEAQTEVRMLDFYPDPLTDGTLADNAVRAVHSEKRLNILNAELRQLRKLMREDQPAIRAKEQGDKREDREARAANKAQLPKRAEMAMLKAGARAKVNETQVRDIKPHVYLRAEQKAGREAFESMERRDYQKAYAAKLRQITNHEMYRAALAVQKEMDTIRKYLARLEGPRKQRQLAKAGVLNQVNAVLEGIELRKKSLAEVDRDTALKELRQAVIEGKMIVTPETMRKIMDETVNWQEFTPEELRGMRDVIKQIEHGAVNEDKMTVNDELVDFKEVEDEIVESLHENNKQIVLRPGGVKTAGERANKNIDQGIMTWLRPSSIARVLDKSGFGAITRRIIVPMRRAYAEKLIPMLHQAQRDVAGFYNKHYTAKELGKMSEQIYHIDGLDTDYSKSELLSMALNWGNEGNRAAVLGGTYEGSIVFNEQTVRQMLAHLTKKDWAFVQDIWDYNDTYREAIFDAEERRRGIRPEKVEASPFEIRTADGETILVRGGYHPLRYDRDYDPKSNVRESPERAAENIEAQMNRVALGSSVSANTRSGSTYNRVKNHGRVVKLGLNIIDSHLREVIRDIAVGDEVLHIKRLLESGSIQRAMIDTNNRAALEALDLWLTDAAVGELPSENIIEFGAAWIRTGFTKAKLGWNFTVMFLQFTGLFQTIAVIGTAAFGRGLAKYMQNPAAAHRTVTEVSSFIKTRYSVGAFDKDIQDTKALVEAEFGNMPTRTKQVYHLIGSTLFAGIAAAQKVVDVVTWLGAYEKGLNDSKLLLSEADAIIYADTQVEAAQTSGFFSDRSGLERGTTGLRKNRQSQFIRIWTTLISYMLAKSNIAYEKHKDTNYKDPKQVMALLYDLIMLYTVEGMASAWLYGRLPEDDDEPEDWALWTAEATLDSLVSGVPFVREIAAARFGGGNTPIGVLSNDTFRMIDQISQGDPDWAFYDATLDVIGTAAHLPTGQMSKTGKKLWEEGLTTDEWWEYFTGPRRD
jgi:hypothetical protein